MSGRLNKVSNMAKSLTKWWCEYGHHLAKSHRYRYNYPVMGGEKNMVDWWTWSDQELYYLPEVTFWDCPVRFGTMFEWWKRRDWNIFNRHADDY